MTLRELNGWAPRSITLAPNGDVLSVTVAEPRFTLDEKAILLASYRAEKAPRGDHGLLLSETMDPANQFAFKASSPVQDWAQKTLNEAREAYRKANPKADLSSVHIRVQHRD